MSTPARFSEAQLITFFHEYASVDDIARRENVSRRGLIARWRALQRRGRLAFERGYLDTLEALPAEAEEQSKPHHYSIAGPPLSDEDGRSSVGDDLLLEELFR